MTSRAYWAALLSTLVLVTLLAVPALGDHTGPRIAAQGIDEEPGLQRTVRLQDGWNLIGWTGRTRRLGPTRSHRHALQGALHI